MAINSTLKAAMSGDHFTTFLAFKFDFTTPAYMTLAGEVSFDINGTPVTFQPEHALWGVMSGMEPVTQQVGVMDATSVRVTVLPSVDEGLAGWMSSAINRKMVYAWNGVVNELTGAVVGTPELIMAGEIGQREIRSGKRSREIILNITTGFERFKIDGQGRRMNKAWWRQVYPNDDCFDVEVMKAANDTVYWGPVEITKSESSYFAPNRSRF